MSTHTPGPWRVDPHDYEDIQTADGSVEIATMMNDDFAYNVAPEAEAAANARLIAAAPELLAALRVVEQAGLIRQDGVIDAGVLAAVQGVARAAIAKAVGDTP